MGKKWKFIASAAVLLCIVGVWLAAAWSLSLVDFEAPEILIFLGRFHPTVLHFPIGLMALSLLIDVGKFFPKKWGIPESNSNPVNFLVVLSATLAIAHGILLFASGGYEGSELAERHLMGACAFLTVIGIGYLLRLHVAALNANRFANFAISFLAFVVLSISSHDGGSLTHGENYLTQYAPNWWGDDEVKASDVREEVSFEDENIYQVAVQPIFDATCVECHKESKSKGRLRMDTFEWFAKGGRDGEPFVPGKPEESLFLELMNYPEDDEDRMPPEGKPQPTREQIKVLEWWVSIGAPSEGSLRSFAPSEELLKTIQSYQE